VSLLYIFYILRKCVTIRYTYTQMIFDRNVSVGDWKTVGEKIKEWRSAVVRIGTRLIWWRRRKLSSCWESNRRPKAFSLLIQINKWIKNIASQSPARKIRQIRMEKWLERKHFGWIQTEISTPVTKNIHHRAKLWPIDHISWKRTV